MLLFLGSGVSVDSGLPGVIPLTDTLLNDDHFSETARSDNRPGSIPEAQALLRFLAELDAHYLSSIAPYASKGTYACTGAAFRAYTSYEDLFYLCKQITQSGMGLADDATTGALVDIVEQRAGKLLNGDVPNARKIYLYHLAQRGSELIERVVAEQLHADKVKGLDLVLELALTNEIAHLDIVTLNHDTLVEQLLTQNGVSFIDGFGRPDGDVRWYNDSLYDKVGKDRIRIVKPHGSVNWYSPTVEGKPCPAIVVSNSLDSCRTADGALLAITLKKPSFLTGGNKVLAYNRGIFSEMFHRFHLMLRENRRMVMSGYGWSDPGVNFRLTNWFDSSRDNSLLLLHQRPDSLESNSLQLAEYYRALVANGQLIRGNRWLSETKLSDLGALWEGRAAD